MKLFHLWEISMKVRVQEDAFVQISVTGHTNRWNFAIKG